MADAPTQCNENPVLELRRSLEQFLEVLLDLVKFPAKAVIFDFNVRPAAGANHFTLLLQPSDRLLELSAATRTLERNLLLVEKACHETPNPSQSLAS